MLKVLLFRIQQYYVNGEWSETNLLGHLSSLEVRDHPETTNHWLICLSQATIKSRLKPRQVGLQLV